VNTLVCKGAFVALATERLNELAKFYEALLNAPPQVFRADVYAEFDLAGLKLGMFQPRQDGAAEFSSPQAAAMSVCLEVADLDAAIAHLTTLGYPPPVPVIKASHGREVYAYDPDGNRLILHQRHPSTAA
jgi:predicted enzyme related to lactoylglutathione lyase